MYPRHMDVPWLQRHRLVYMGFVHCGSAFQMPFTMVQISMYTYLFTYTNMLLSALRALPADCNLDHAGCQMQLVYPPWQPCSLHLKSFSCTLIEAAAAAARILGVLEKTFVLHLACPLDLEP